MEICFSLLANENNRNINVFQMCFSLLFDKWRTERTDAAALSLDHEAMDVACNWLRPVLEQLKLGRPQKFPLETIRWTYKQ